MIYINEALKKAQKQRETNYQEYSGVTSRPAKKGRLFPGNLVLWTAIIFVFISVAFGIYYWFAFNDPEILFALS